MVEFTRIGFDLRTRCDDYPTADALAWPQVESTYRNALSMGFLENSFQLLQVDSRLELQRLISIASAAPEPVDIVELAIFSAVAGSKNAHGLEGIEAFPLDPDEIEVEGYDACDLDGLFSAFSMGFESLRRGRGCAADALLDTCIVAQSASLLVPSHAPFVTVRIRVLARRQRE